MLKGTSWGFFEAAALSVKNARGVGAEVTVIISDKRGAAGGERIALEMSTATPMTRMNMSP